MQLPSNRIQEMVSSEENQRLIKELNPTWNDLGADVLQDS